MKTVPDIRTRVQRLEAEKGTIRKDAPVRVALGSPLPYRGAMASLGLQTVYRALNDWPPVAAERFFLPDGWPGETGPLVTLESGRPAAQSRVIAFSVSHELELAPLCAMLAMCGVDPMREGRGASDPVVVVGGPLTLVDPRLFHTLADLVVVGEGEPLFAPLGRLLETSSDKAELLDAAADLAGAYVPAIHGEDAPPPARAERAMLPAVGCIATPLSELKDVFLVEAARGCPYGCTFCVMAGRRAGAFRPVASAAILEAVPSWASHVGLVGAAVTSHPELEAILDAFLARRVNVSVASLRADRLTAGLLERLQAAGTRTLTLAADGPSERARERLCKGVRAEHLLAAADLAREAGLRRIKLYVMVGLPEEEDADLDELAALCRSMARRAPLTLAAQALVPKPGTPLAGFVPPPVPELERRLTYLKKRLGGVVRVKAGSARWSWVEHRIAHAGSRAGLWAALAGRHGATLAAWKRAIDGD